MEPENDTVPGGEGLSVEQAAAAYLSKSETGADQGQPIADQVDDGNADDLIEDLPEGEEQSDGEPDQEGQVEEDEGDEPESDGGRFVAGDGKVRLPDGSIATVADLIQGNLRDRDYRQKTMSLADERRQFEEQSSSFKAIQQQVNEERAYIQQIWEAMAPPPPDPRLIDRNSPDYDPLGFQEAEYRYNSFHANLNYMRQQADEAKRRQEAETNQVRQKRAADEWSVLQDVLPELKDKAKVNAFVEDIRSAATKAGFSPQEIAETVPYDHRYALILKKAAAYDKLQASRPKVKEQMQNRPPVQRGGKRMSPDAQRSEQATEAFKRLKTTGTVEDAARAYLSSRRG